MKVNVMKKVLAVAMAACVVIGSGYGTRAMAGTAEGEKTMVAEYGVSEEVLPGQVREGLQTGQKGVSIKEDNSDWNYISDGTEILFDKKYANMDTASPERYFKINVPADGEFLVYAEKVNAETGIEDYPKIGLCDANKNVIKDAVYPRYYDSQYNMIESAEGAASFAVKKGTYYIYFENLYQNYVAFTALGFEKGTVRTNTGKGTASSIAPKASYTGMLDVNSGEKSNWYKFTLNSAQPNELTITNRSLSTLEYAVTGPGNLSFSGKIKPLESIYLYMYDRLTGVRIDWTKGTYYVQITGTNTTYTISRKAYLQAMSVSLAKTSYTYTGKALKPAVTVKNGSAKLVNGTDYTVSYSNNKNVGTAKVTIKGKGSYEGTVTKTFKINPKTTKITGTTAGKKQLTVKWKKISNVDGYQLRYSTKSSMSGAKNTSRISKSKSSYAIKKLKSGKKYYVQVRTYRKVGKTYYYSTWSSKVKSKTIK